MKDFESDFNKFADVLDKNDFTKEASKLRDIVEDYSFLKTAQYIGTQGYWVRNERCWSNCYRDKRASNPNMASQKVWKECHKEYVDYTNNSNTKWDKYASDVKNIKISSNQDLENHVNQLEEKIIEKHIKEASSIEDLYNKRNEEYLNEYLKISNKLIDLADYFKESSLPAIGRKIASVTKELIKEAQEMPYYRDIFDKAYSTKNMTSTRQYNTRELFAHLNYLSKLIQKTLVLQKNHINFIKKEGLIKDNKFTNKLFLIVGKDINNIKEYIYNLPTYKQYNKSAEELQKYVFLVSQDISKARSVVESFDPTVSQDFDNLLLSFVHLNKGQGRHKKGYEIIKKINEILVKIMDYNETIENTNLTKYNKPKQDIVPYGNDQNTESYLNYNYDVGYNDPNQPTRKPIDSTRLNQPAKERDFTPKSTILPRERWYNKAKNKLKDFTRKINPFNSGSEKRDAA